MLPIISQDEKLSQTLLELSVSGCSPMAAVFVDTI